MIVPLSSNASIEVRSVNLFPPGNTYDRLHRYIIKDRQLFWRSRRSESEWKSISLLEGCIPYQVKADWENLMVLDTDGNVHYTKSMNGDDSLINNLPWQKGIWNFPIISAIYNRIVGNPNFIVSEGGIWDCSYLESGCRYIDGIGNCHFLGNKAGMIEATTTAYVADQENRCFRYYDPYVPPWAEDAETINIPFPETAHSTFELKGFASCRSQLFLIGYDLMAAEKGGVEKKLTLYTISADANLMGLNPAISYTYSTENIDKASFVLPASRYRKLPMPEGSITSVVGIERAEGKLMTDVVLKVEGELNGAAGFFYLNPGENRWQFQEFKNHIIESEAFLELEYVDEYQMFSSSLQNWNGYVFESGYSAVLRNFGIRAMESKVVVEVDGEVYEIPLYVRQNQWNLIGFDRIEYTLVLSQEVQKVLNWDVDEVMPVLFEKDGNELEIKTKHGHKKLFCFRGQDIKPEKRKCQIM